MNKCPENCSNLERPYCHCQACGETGVVLNDHGYCEEHSDQNKRPTIPAPLPEDIDDTSPTIPMKRSEYEAEAAALDAAAQRGWSWGANVSSQYSDS